MAEMQRMNKDTVQKSDSSNPVVNKMIQTPDDLVDWVMDLLTSSEQNENQIIELFNREFLITIPHWSI